MRALRFFLGAVAGLAFGACGARSSLPLPRHDTGGGGQGGMPPDAGVDAPIDVAPDVPPDVPPPFDCAEAGVTYVYLVSDNNVLYAYYPPDGTITERGTISCEPPGGATPYSMGVDRFGFAYVVFTDGNLFKVNLADASCEPTPFVPDQHGFHVFGMGFSRVSMGDTLYVTDITYGDAGVAVPSKGLASIDVKSFELNPVGQYPQPVFAMELTGTGDGRLFGYSLNESNSGGRILQIDTASANIIGDTPLPVGDSVSALAFAFWGGDFYIFTTVDEGSTEVTRYSPGDGTLLQVGTIADVIVGAGVSTCAPE